VTSIRNRWAVSPDADMFNASKSPIGSAQSHRGFHDLHAAVPDLGESVQFEAVFGELGRFGFGVDAVAVGALGADVVGEDRVRSVAPEMAPIKVISVGSRMLIGDSALSSAAVSEPLGRSAVWMQKDIPNRGIRSSAGSRCR
jgi:hypothetical protein